MEPTSSPTVYTSEFDAKLLAASKALLDACDHSAINELTKLGFRPSDEHHQHWADIIFSMSGVDWNQTSKIILFLFDHCKAVGEVGLPFPKEEDLTKIAINKFPRYFQQAHEQSSDFMASYIEAPVAPDPKLLAKFAPSLIPDYFACNLNSIEFNQETREEVIDNFKILRPFFAVIKTVVETLPEHFDEIFKNLKAEILESRAIMESREDHNGTWIQLIYFGMLVQLHNQTFNDLQEICSNPKNASSVYTLYRSLYLNERQNDYQQATMHRDLIFDLEPREQKRLGEIIQLVNGSAIEVFNFYLQNPKFQSVLERIAKSNTADQQKQQAITTFVEYFSNDSKQLQDLIIASATEPKKLLAVLNPDFLGNLSETDHAFIKKVHDFIMLSKDLELYTPIIKAIENDDLPRADLMITGAIQINKPGDSTNHQKRVTFIQKISILPESELPETVIENFILKILSNSNQPISESVIKNSTSFSQTKRKGIEFQDVELTNAYHRFQAFKSGRLFLALIQEFGEKSEPVINASQDITNQLENNFYRTFLNDPRLRRLYFQSILTNQEFLAEFQERIIINKNNQSNPKHEAELFSKWLQSRQAEISQPTLVTQESSIDERAEVVPSLNFRRPPFFQKIVIVAPTERIRLDLMRIQESIPSLNPSMIQILNSEMRTSLLDTARHLNPDRLMLFMASNTSHSTYYSLLANIPDARRNNLYIFHGMSSLYNLLAELDIWKASFTEHLAKRL